METESNAVTTELFEFMTHCASDQLSEETRRKATQYLRVVTELEEVCDCCNRLINRAAERYKKISSSPRKSKKQSWISEGASSDSLISIFLGWNPKYLLPISKWHSS